MKFKQIVLSLLFGLVAIAAQGQIKVEISEPVELMCILSRTAEFQEYGGDMCGQYGKDADEWFAPYKQHAIIPYYQNLRAQYGIAHERVMSMALHLEIEKGKVQFIGDKSDLYGGWKNDFRWTPELVSSLRYYANHRDMYKTLNDFYPEIFQCLKKYLEDEVARLLKPLS